MRAAYSYDDHCKQRADGRWTIRDDEQRSSRARPRLVREASGADKRPVEGPESGEPLDSGALQDRLIAYAASLRETADASEDAFSKGMKVTLTPFEPGRPGGEPGNQPVADGYAFHASFGGLAGGMKVPYYGISLFRPGDKPLTDDPNAPCF